MARKSGRVRPNDWGGTGPPTDRDENSRHVCLELEDYSVARYSAVDFFNVGDSRTPEAQAARLAEQFVAQNRATMAVLDVRIDRAYDGKDLSLLIESGSCVGAVPLISPTTARPDYGLVVQPRFAWSGIGPLLAETGWRVCPTPLRLPLLRRSERRVPLWVLSFMILTRLRGLLDSMTRRFEMVSEDRPGPRGTVSWTEYATRRLPLARFLSVPCIFADLRDDRMLKGAVRYAVEKQLQALETQKHHGVFVQKLIELGQQLLRKVGAVPVYIPTPSSFQSWLQHPMRNEHFSDGIQAIEWTVDERGLAGLSDLQGVPWIMPMERFFEAWVETVFCAVTRQTGGLVKVGRKRETTHPVNWEPPYLGSQKSLVPDMWIEWDSLTLIVDAKYKRHWEEMQEQSWGQVNDQIREQHRADFLQVLAYANLAHTERVVACLVYPCSPKKWTELKRRNRLVHRAQVGSVGRSVHVWLTAVPMDSALDTVALSLAEEIRSQLH